MIPKTIHYCWFGKNPYSKLMNHCIKTWKEHLTDYEFIEWNEDNFDINSNKYVSEAYSAKKWAFVSDYVRLWAIYNYGGVYLDTDVEVLKSLNDLLDNKAFTGFENSLSMVTGIIASEKHNQIIETLLKDYDERTFILQNGEFDLTTNTKTITNQLKEIGFLSDNTLQVKDNFTLYPKDYFCPKDGLSGFCNITKNTYVIHHFNGSWLSKEEQETIKKSRLKSKIIVFVDKYIPIPDALLLKLLGKRRFDIFVNTRNMYKK